MYIWMGPSMTLLLTSDPIPAVVPSRVIHGSVSAMLFDHVLASILWLLLLSACRVHAATGPANNGRALRPPLGWRHWNQFNGAISQDIVEANMRALADRSRTVNGRPTSLADLGYVDAGIDDGWQQCGDYGEEHYTYHTSNGNPVIDADKFPDLSALTALGHSLGLTVGWYGNACGCAAQPYPQCCSDHCDTLECFAGDVDAALSLGFDSFKVDGCGAQRDIELWSHMFNHSVTSRRNSNISVTPVGVMLENCHDMDGLPQPGEPGSNEPFYGADGELWCPFHTYRTSGDARPTYGSLLTNLNSTRRLADANLSLPGCWAYADMLEIGVSATGGLKDCGESGAEVCLPLSVTEARSHFGAWAIVSSPLVLGLDLRNTTMVDLHWDTISNVDAISVNQDYAGHSGSQFAQSTEMTTLVACDWKPGVRCEWPSWTAWYKMLSRRDGRRSEAAVLLMNNSPSPQTLNFSFSAIPGIGSLSEGCKLWDVWGRRSLGRITNNPNFAQVPSHDSVFLTLSDCK